MEQSEDEGSGMFVEGYTEDEYGDEEHEEEEEEEEEEAVPYHSHWSSSEDEDEEFDMTIVLPAGDDDEPLLDSEGTLYDNIAAAFMQAMTSQQAPNTTGTNTPIIGAEYHPLSAFELTNALNSVIHHQYDGISRRPSLPSNTVSAAHRHRGSHDLSTSEALSALVLDNLSLAALEPIQEQKEKEEEKNQQETIIEDHSLNKQDNVICNIDSRISPSQYLEALTTSIMLEQHRQQQQQQQEGKRKMDMLTAVHEQTDNDKKKLRTEDTYPSSAPASPAAIIDELEDMINKEQNEEQVTMDDLVDTSRLDNHSPSLDHEQDELLSRDLSRWQRIPIGAFRLMRSKNRLWLER
ncbi:hypothetical protein BD560DRAFT_399876 [Blakeslea trispora]|nr:hypothetical protein BD560DRAFT_399876 [Blakeslea trispora]